MALCRWHGTSSQSSLRFRSTDRKCFKGHLNSIFAFWGVYPRGIHSKFTIRHWSYKWHPHWCYHHYPYAYQNIIYYSPVSWFWILKVDVKEVIQTDDPKVHDSTRFWKSFQSKLKQLYQEAFWVNMLWSVSSILGKWNPIP